MASELRADPERVAHSLAKTLRMHGALLAFEETIRGGLASAPSVPTRESSAPPSVSSEPPGAIEGHADLEVDRVLAEGGMGRVILARQRSLSREVAVKTVRPELMGSPISLELHAEGVITGSLEHPNIIPVHALSVGADGQLFLVMKRVDGTAWSDLLADPEHPGWDRVGVIDGDRLAANLAILSAVCNAVEFAHRHGVIHRDIKPQNVMIGEVGDVYLVDWGIATALDAEDPRYRKESLGFVGTPAYVAPEMLGDDGGQPDVRTDTYLLGATLHVVLTGRTRHEGPTLMAMLVSAAASDPASYGPEVPDELARIANRACAREPAERFPSARAFRDALAEFLRHRASAALAEDAHARLERLRALRAEGAGDRRELRRLEVECRYGFAHAIESWSGNARAREGLRECLLLAVRDQIASGDLATAESTLLELDAPPEEIVTALEALRAEVRAQRERDARARELERQTDWQRGALPRIAFFFAFGAIAFFIWFWVTGWRVHVPETLAPERLATGMALMLAASCVAVFVARRQILRSQVSARLVYGVLATLAALTLHRVANLIPAPATATLVSGDILLCAYGAAIASITLAPWMAFQIPIWIVAAFAARLAPSLAGVWFASAGTLAFLGSAWKLRPRAPRDDAAAERAGDDRRGDAGSRGA